MSSLACHFHFLNSEMSWFSGAMCLDTCAGQQGYTPICTYEVWASSCRGLFSFLCFYCFVCALPEFRAWMGENGKVEGRGIRESGPGSVPRDTGNVSWVWGEQEKLGQNGWCSSELWHSEKDWRRARNFHFGFLRIVKALRVGQGRRIWLGSEDLWGGW